MQTVSSKFASQKDVTDWSRVQPSGDSITCTYCIRGRSSCFLFSTFASTIVFLSDIKADTPPVPVRQPRRRSQPDTGVHPVTVTSTPLPFPAPVVSMREEQDNNATQFQYFPFSQATQHSATSQSIARPRPRPSHFATQQPPQPQPVMPTQQWPQQTSQPKVGFNPFAISSVSNGQAVPELNSPSSLPPTLRQVGQRFSVS